MKPIIRAVNPIGNIELIEIFPGEYDESGAIYFPVKIDRLQLTFHLDQDAFWNYTPEEKITDEIRHLIGDLIEGSHS